MRIVLALGIAAAALVAGCVEPAYPPSGPIQLQPYPPQAVYRTSPDYSSPFVGPVPLQNAPPLVAEPLPPPTAMPDATTLTPDPSLPPVDGGLSPADNLGAIPLQDMPAPAPDSSAPADQSSAPQSSAPQSSAPQSSTTGAAAPTPAAKVPTAGPGSNVPLEGFRPMRGQTRPAP